MKKASCQSKQDNSNFGIEKSGFAEVSGAGEKQVIEAINSFEGYHNFISDVSSDPRFCDPHFAYDPDNLYGSLHRENEYAFAVMTGGKIQGLFVWLINSDERYIELLIGLTRHEAAFSEMLSRLEERYCGYRADFVINPQNEAMTRVLNGRNAVFDKEQQKMLLTGAAPDTTADCVEEYSEKWREQYCALHRTDTYWTAERVLSASDRFRVLLAVQDNRIVGYLDVTYGCDINEPYDLWVRPELPFGEYALPLLAEAAKRNGANQMMALVYTEATEEIEAYAAAGFAKVEGQNSVYASYRL